RMRLSQNGKYKYGRIESTCAASLRRESERRIAHDSVYLHKNVEPRKALNYPPAEHMTETSCGLTGLLFCSASESALQEPERCPARLGEYSMEDRPRFRAKARRLNVWCEAVHCEC